jgi:trehalose-6-phosphatase
MNWYKYVAEASKKDETTELFTSDDIKDIMDFTRTKVLGGWRVNVQRPTVVTLEKDWQPQDVLKDAASRIGHGK